MSVDDVIKFLEKFPGAKLVLGKSLESNAVMGVSLEYNADIHAVVLEPVLNRASLFISK